MYLTNKKIKFCKTLCISSGTILFNNA